ncbi:MAG: DUF2490 domain-containing protein [Flavisolibacter sp.]
MKKQITIGIAVLMLIGLDIHAQSDKQIERLEQVWTGYFNQTRFSNRWGVWFDGQLRTKDNFFTELSTLIIRPGITYYISDATKLTAGYGYINHYPGDNHKEISQPEHRPWQQVQWHTKYSKVRTMQYLRLEERFRRKILNDSTLAEGHNFNFRFRYAFLLQVPLTNKPIGKGDFSFIVNDEIHINLGKEILYNTFDQNRFFLGFAYHTNANDNFQFGYMHMFQQLAAGNMYKSVHAARVFYFHNLDLRKKS